MDATNITFNYYEPINITTTTIIMARTRRRRQTILPFARPPTIQEDAQPIAPPVAPPVAYPAEEAQVEDPFEEVLPPAEVSQAPPQLIQEASSSSSSAAIATPNDSSGSSSKKPPKRNSWIWNHMPDDDPETRYFDENGNEVWRCAYCDKAYRVSGSTTPCIDHLTDPEGKSHIPL